MRDLSALPKAHLHLHLEAGMRHSTLVDLAGRYGLEVPVIGGYGNFSAFSGTVTRSSSSARSASPMGCAVRKPPA